MRNPLHIQKTALAVTRAVGSPFSIGIHTVLFILSFLATTEGYISFDRMLLVLTTVVSLEAIYLSLFIQMTINQTTQSIQEVGEDIEEIQEDIGEIQEDVDELQEDVEEITEEDEVERLGDVQEKDTLAAIQADLHRLLADVERLRNNHGNGSVNGSSQNTAVK